MRMSYGHQEMYKGLWFVFSAFLMALFVVTCIILITIELI